MGTGEAHSQHPRGAGLSLPRTNTGPHGHSSVWEVSYQMFEGEKILIFLAFFSFYFLIIFLDDFISKKGVGERREQREGGREP